MKKYPLLRATVGIFLLGIVAALAACGDTEQPAPQAYEDNPDLPEQTQFWQRLAHQCGNAYGGRITQKPEGADLFDGREYLVVHFRECGDEELRLPFHAQTMEGEWNRSRTWVLFHHDDELELRHDHRHEDGTEEDNTWYGAFTGETVTAQRTEFIRQPPAARPDLRTGWRIEIVPDVRYTYGTIRNGEWGWRLDFDLTRPIDPPPAPWGHE
ncbi:MAG: hypothetical protein ACNA78_05150 [Balneolaceae bacterium]